MSSSVPATMQGVQLTGLGGYDKLVYRDDIPVPTPGAGEVLVRVSAAGMNNTDINTRIGWYNSEVTSGTQSGDGIDGVSVKKDSMGDWSVGLSFPRIQGMDVSGRIASVGLDVDASRVGERVVCDPYIHKSDAADAWITAGLLGADHDGGFAQYTVVPARNACVVSDDLTPGDEALATLPCSGGTAMNMLLLAGVGPGDRMVVTGASGGVGSFLVQIGVHLGAEVIAIAGRSKAEQVRAMGATAVIDREESDHAAAIRTALGGESISVIADVVGGDQFPAYLSLLAQRGRYVTAGAIAGPMVSLDLRTLYLKSLVFYGSTNYLPETFGTLVKIVEAGGITPLVDCVRPLAEIHDAQRAFLEKRHVGNLVLTPPSEQ